MTRAFITIVRVGKTKLCRNAVYRYGFGDPSDTVCSVWIFESLKNGLNRERRAHAPERFTRFGTRPASVCSVCVHGTVLVAQPRFGLVTVCVGAA